MTQHPVIIVGAGVAGLFTALKLAQHQIAVTVISAAPLAAEAASAWAQGGIAAAIADGDSAKDHAEDTVIAGAGLTNPAIALGIAEEAPARVRDLEAFGVQFARNKDGSPHLALEGAHRAPRVLHADAGDSFGAELIRALAAAARAEPLITLIEGEIVTAIEQDDQGRAAFAAAGPVDGSAPVIWHRASHIILATGGAGGLFATTTNPLGATGTGLALGGRLGLTLQDMEFVQFHPTALKIGRDPAPLATEALRGEGAVLRLGDGSRLMDGAHPMADLAPRDIVARQIFAAISEGHDVLLDASDAVGDKFPHEFPAVFKAAMDFGIDPRRDGLPVAPAAHYHMGGIATGPDGSTFIDGFWAVGEVACTGLHGANRLASNSLTEAVVIGARIADAIAGQTTNHGPTAMPDTPTQLAPASDWAVATMADLRRAMDRQMGVARNDRDLNHLLGQLSDWYDQNQKTETPSARLAAMIEVASAMAMPALLRNESIGSHFRSDYPLGPKLGEPGADKKFAHYQSSLGPHTPLAPHATPDRLGRQTTSSDSSASSSRTAL